MYIDADGQTVGEGIDDFPNDDQYEDEIRDSQASEEGETECAK